MKIQVRIHGRAALVMVACGVVAACSASPARVSLPSPTPTAPAGAEVYTGLTPTAETRVGRVDASGHVYLYTPKGWSAETQVGSVDASGYIYGPVEHQTVHQVGRAYTNGFIYGPAVHNAADQVGYVDTQGRIHAGRGTSGDQVGCVDPPTSPELMGGAAFLLLLSPPE
jgi:hypothetical protein